MIINVIPLAWKGGRFKKAWYSLPKPLIDVKGKKMIFRAFESLPNNSWKNIFICLKDHIEKYQIDKLIQEKISNSLIIPDIYPSWQATSTALIRNYVNDSDVINIWSCDNSMIYNLEKYNSFINDPNIDFFVWTFKNYHWVNYNPDQYSYCKVDKDENIISVSLKKAISSKPINDNTLVWAFTFNKAKFFFDNYKELVENKDTINWEFYIDSIIKYCLKKSLKWKVFLVDKYIWFWTPNDLKTYEYWYEYFKLQNN